MRDFFYLSGKFPKKGYVMKQNIENKPNSRKPDTYKCAKCRYKSPGFLCYNASEDKCLRDWQKQIIKQPNNNDRGIF